MQQYNKANYSKDMTYMRKISEWPFESDITLIEDSQVYEFDGFTFHTDYQPGITSTHDIMYNDVKQTRLNPRNQRRFEERMLWNRIDAGSEYEEDDENDCEEEFAVKRRDCCCCGPRPQQPIVQKVTATPSPIWGNEANKNLLSLRESINTNWFERNGANPRASRMPAEQPRPYQPMVNSEAANPKLASRVPEERSRRPEGCRYDRPPNTRLQVRSSPERSVRKAQTCDDEHRRPRNTALASGVQAPQEVARSKVQICFCGICKPTANSVPRNRDDHAKGSRRESRVVAPEQTIRRDTGQGASDVARTVGPSRRPERREASRGTSREPPLSPERDETFYVTSREPPQRTERRVTYDVKPSNAARNRRTYKVVPGSLREVPNERPLDVGRDMVITFSAKGTFHVEHEDRFQPDASSRCRSTSRRPNIRGEARVKQ